MSIKYIYYVWIVFAILSCSTPEKNKYALSNYREVSSVGGSASCEDITTNILLSKRERSVSYQVEKFNTLVTDFSVNVTSEKRQALNTIFRNATPSQKINILRRMELKTGNWRSFCQ